MLYGVCSIVGATCLNNYMNIHEYIANMFDNDFKTECVN